MKVEIIPSIPKIGDDMYKVGDTVVHLSHGLGTIVGIEEREFTPHTKQTFYIMEIDDNGAPKKVFVPMQIADTRLRKLMTTTEVDEVFAILANSKLSIDNNRSWHMIYREYMEMIHSGQATQIARVVRILTSLKYRKDLSFGERKLLEQGLNLISSELTTVMGTTLEHVEGLLRATLED